MNSILIVEDSGVVREPLSRLLRLEGYETIIAGNGAEALASLKKSPVDLLLLDLLLPKIDGLSLLQTLRADPRFTALPVILLTGVIEGSMLDRARGLGVLDILHKARFSFDELLGRIHVAMANHRAAPSRGEFDASELVAASSA